MSDDINDRRARIEAKRRAEIDRAIMEMAAHLTAPRWEIHIQGDPPPEAIMALVKICRDNYPRGSKP